MININWFIIEANENTVICVWEVEKMAKETVEAVRQAENKAIQIENDAVIKHDSIILQAQKEAESIISSLTKEAKKIAEQNSKQAQIQGEEFKKNAEIKAENEILLLKELTKSKEQETIHLILSEVI